MYWFEDNEPYWSFKEADKLANWHWEEVKIEEDEEDEDDDGLDEDFLNWFGD